MSGSDRSAGTPPLVTHPNGDRESGQKAAPGDNAASNDTTVNITLPVKQAPSPNKSAITDAQTQITQPDPYQLRDLKAQEDMAYWAMWMFAAAALTFIITSIGTFLIWRQVKLTRRAVEDTDKATRAMEAANELASTANHRQLRAYLGADEAKIIEAQFTAVRGRAIAEVIIKNYGQTPATIISHKKGIWIGATTVGDPAISGGNLNDDIPQAPINPGGICVLQIEGGVESGIFNSRDKALYIYGHLIFRDCFGHTHHLKYAFHILGVQIMSAAVPMKRCVLGNSAD